MTKSARQRYGCSPLSITGCGCGFVAGLGILLVFLVLTIHMVKERRDPTWNRQSYAQCQENLIYLRQALRSYEGDYHHLPATLDDLRKGGYIDHPSRLRCPLEVQEHGEAYTYTPHAKHPTDPLITCANHGQGRLILQKNGRLHMAGLFKR